jgi:DNA mismatch repair protein MutL
MTSRIALLSDDIINQIAAGEVVERPASVVKELVENAIDAGSTRVTVEVAEAGRRLIRVTDDGEGMSPQEAALAFHRHATSKIRNEADLCAIRTMGFRGEALPSIAAVSKVRLVTVPAGAASGTEIRLEGGSLKAEREAAAAPGTMVEVAELFYNTPARRKFLKSPATEFGHICQVVQRQALAFPRVHFRLQHNGASVAEYPAVRSLRERVRQVYGEALVEASVDVSAEARDLRLEGLCCSPLETTQSRTPQDIFVNRRWVKSPSIAHAVYDGYGTCLAKGHHPRFILALSVEPRLVDVNVHPTKREVRFSDQEHVHELVRTRVQAVLAYPVASTVPPGPAGSVTDPRPLEPPRWMDRIAEAAQPYLPTVAQEVRPMGQIADRYILAQVGEELQIVDQHTAHERVLYERLCAQIEEGAIPSQQSLLPQPVELAASAAVLVRAHLADLERLGFEVEDFGGGAFLVRAMPALVGRADPVAILKALVEDWEAEASTPSAKEQYHAVLASLACHSAVRSGRRLELPEMRRLLEDWRDAGHPVTCPHGRRIAMRLTIEELDRIFGRQGWT